MSLQSLTSIHSIIPLIPSETTGPTMGVEIEYTPGKPIPCNTQRLGSREREKYGIGEQVRAYRVFFGCDPKLTILHQLEFRGDVLRVHGVWEESDGSGCDVLWICDSEKIGAAQDSGGTTTPQPA